MDEQDQIIRVYSRLNALKDSLSDDRVGVIHERYIFDYHEIIQKLSEITNSELDEFQIPESEMHIIQTGGYLDQETGEMHMDYSVEKYCDKYLFFSKLNAILQYFTFKYLSTEKEPIGFKKPE